MPSEAERLRRTLDATPPPSTLAIARALVAAGSVLQARQLLRRLPTAQRREVIRSVRRTTRRATRRAQQTRGGKSYMGVRVKYRGVFVRGSISEADAPMLTDRQRRTVLIEVGELLTRRIEDRTPIGKTTPDPGRLRRSWRRVASAYQFTIRNVAFYKRGVYYAKYVEAWAHMVDRAIKSLPKTIRISRL